MWLRDSAHWRTSGVRVLLYGYDTTLVKSESFQNIDDIGGDLRGLLSGIRAFRQVFIHTPTVKLEQGCATLLMTLQYRVI